MFIVDEYMHNPIIHQLLHSDSTPSTCDMLDVMIVFSVGPFDDKMLTEWFIE